jgi:hypothetical protein
MNPEHEHQLGTGRINADRASNTIAEAVAQGQPASLQEVGMPIEQELVR